MENRNFEEYKQIDLMNICKTLHKTTAGYITNILKSNALSEHDENQLNISAKKDI